MSFIDQIPQHLKDLEAELTRLGRQRVDLDWGDDGHECDCEYCDQRGKGAKVGDPEVEEKAEAIDIAVKDCRTMMDRLKRYAKTRGVELDDIRTSPAEA